MVGLSIFVAKITIGGYVSFDFIEVNIEKKSKMALKCFSKKKFYVSGNFM